MFSRTFLNHVNHSPSFERVVLLPFSLNSFNSFLQNTLIRNFSEIGKGPWKFTPHWEIVGTLLKEDVDGLGTKLCMFLQNHWGEVHHKPWLTRVRHCQECPRTDLCPDSGVVSSRLCSAPGGSHLTVDMEFWWRAPTSVVVKAA